MTRENSSTHSTPRPKKPQPEQASTDFDKPDSEQAAEGAPTHEQSSAHGAGKKADDARHGYSQDSGYQGSGGNGHEAPAKQRSSTAVSDDSRTPFDHKT